MKIKFNIHPKLKDAVPYPEPAGKFLPEYYKKISPQVDSNPKNSTVKRCVPFLESMRMGYIIPLWADMYVKSTENDITVDFPPNFQQSKTLDTHAYSQMPEHPLSTMPHGKTLLKFINPWIIETEPGVSCLFTSPFNHMETRFKIIDGAVDTDTYYNNINFPFVWTQSNGEWLVPRGFPLVQVIPFVRNNSEYDIGLIDEDRHQHTISSLGTKLKDGYRDLFWNKNIND